MTLNRSDIGSLLRLNGLSPRRRFGQNFVVDPNTVRRIVRLAGVTATDNVVEIGAGLGSLTLALAETGARIVAVEIDTGIVPVLRAVVAAHPNVTVLHADAMGTDWVDAIAALDPSPGWVLVANLPYNVATPLIADVLDGVALVRRLFVMVQKEVGERLAATPGSRAYGAVSVKVAYHATARIVGEVPASVFLPRPDVTSALVDIRRHAAPVVDAGVAAERLFALVRAAFGQRRKMLRRSLAGMVPPEAFALAAVSGESRPEDLDLHAFARLAMAAP